MVLGQARITDEGVTQLKTRIGSYFKGEYIFAYNKTMTKGGIAHWGDGIGDYNNKLYRDEEYAKKTKYGCIIAPPFQSSRCLGQARACQHCACFRTPAHAILNVSPLATSPSARLPGEIYM